MAFLQQLTSVSNELFSALLSRSSLSLLPLTAIAAVLPFCFLSHILLYLFSSPVLSILRPAPFRSCEHHSQFPAQPAPVLSSSRYSVYARSDQQVVAGDDVGLKLDLASGRQI